MFPVGWGLSALVFRSFFVVGAFSTALEPFFVIILLLTLIGAFRRGVQLEEAGIARVFMS